MGLVNSLPEGDALSENESERQCSSTGVNVNRGASRIVDHGRHSQQVAKIHDPTATPHPRGYGEIDEDRK